MTNFVQFQTTNICYNSAISSRTSLCTACMYVHVHFVMICYYYYIIYYIIYICYEISVDMQTRGGGTCPRAHCLATPLDTANKSVTSRCNGIWETTRRKRQRTFARANLLRTCRLRCGLCYGLATGKLV